MLVSGGRAATPSWVGCCVCVCVCVCGSEVHSITMRRAPVVNCRQKDSGSVKLGDGPRERPLLTA